MKRHLPFRAFLMATSVAVLSPLAAASELTVVASFSIIGDLARQVGGEGINLTTLVGPDSDAHVYEPRPADARTLAAADVILANGLAFEGFLGRLIGASGTDAAIIELTDGGNLREDPEGGHYHGDVFHAGEYDPHAWQAVDNARIYVANIADAFCAADSDGCETYRANAEAYDGNLAALDAEIRKTVAAIPEDRRTIITPHDAFGYFEDAYGVRFIAPTGVSTEAEASAADIAAIVDRIRAEDVSAIFVENIANPRLIERIAAETGMAIGGTLYSDALSAEGGPAATYLDMMRHNVRTISDATAGN